VNNFKNQKTAKVFLEGLNVYLVGGSKIFDFLSLIGYHLSLKGFCCFLVFLIYFFKFKI